MFDWLELPGPVATDLQGLDGFAPDWLLAVDTSAPERLGQELQNAMDPQRTVNIDHHSDNPLYAAVNWVDPERAAVGEMVGGLAKTLGVPLSGPLGEAVYLALVTDTGYFSYDNTTAATMELAAELLRQGLNPGAFGSKHLNQWTVARLMLFSRVLGQTAFHCHGRVGVIRIPDRLFQETGAGLEDTDGLVDQVRRVKGRTGGHLPARGRNRRDQVQPPLHGRYRRAASGGPVPGRRAPQRSRRPYPRLHGRSRAAAGGVSGPDAGREPLGAGEDHV